MTGKHESAEVSGGFGAASTFGSLDGWTLAEVDEYLSSHPELERRTISSGDYRRYLFRDGSELIVRPNGQMIRLPHRLYAPDGKRIRGMRLNTATGQVIPSAAWHNLPRNEQEWVVIDDNTN